MTIQKIDLGHNTVDYIISEEVLLRKEQDALDLMGEVQSDYLIVHDYNFDPEAFDISTKILGDVLQKFANYRVKLAVIGDFEKYPSNILKDFIRESNRHGDYIFVPDLDEVKKLWK